MKIVYLHQYFNTPATAGGTRSYEMGRRLVKYGHEVHMITSYRDKEVRDNKTWFQTNEAGIIVHWLPVPYSNKMSYRERIAVFFKFAWKATLKAASTKCDLVFATSTPLTIAFPAVYASRKQKVPMVFEVRDLWPELPIAVGALKNPVAIKTARWLESFAYNNSKRIVALSPGMKDGIIKTGYPVDKVEVIPNSCDLDFFSVGEETGKKLRETYPWLQDRPLIIYTGTLGIINGVEYLARLAERVWHLDKDIRFLIIGEGKGEDAVKKEAIRLGVLNQNLYLMPKLPKNEIPAWLSAADVATSLFVDLEEMWANSANKFFDALAAGKPVAINYRGWQAEIIKKTGAGIILDPIDLKRSAIMVAEKVRDIEWLKEAGKAARKLAEERFERNKLAGELEKVLLKVVEGS